MLNVLSINIVLYVYPWVPLYYHFVRIKFASIVLPIFAPVWAVLTNAMNPGVLFFFCWPMLICLTLMNFALQSREGVDHVFKALKDLEDRKTWAGRPCKYYMRPTASRIWVKPAAWSCFPG